MSDPKASKMSALLSMMGDAEAPAENTTEGGVEEDTCPTCGKCGMTCDDCGKAPSACTC
jgi:hypothetical protein